MNLAQNALKDVILSPFWLDGGAPDIEQPLIGHTNADLAIVGGGFTGLWAAIQAKEANPDQDVVLIEADRIAQGASGRPGGIVANSVVHGLSNAARIFPNDLKQLETLGTENMKGFRETLRRYNIDCDEDWSGELTVAVSEKELGHLNEEYQLHREHGHEAELLDRSAVQAEIASPLFQGGFWTRGGGGTVHPAKLAWGLKNAAKQLGVRIYELTPMRELSESGEGMAIKCADGEIRARRVLLATNAYASGHRKIRKRVAAIRDRVIATEPLTQEQMRRFGWNNRQGVYDTRTQMNYYRLTRDNRIIFGGRLGYFFGDNTNPTQDKSAETYERLVEAFFNTFPMLDDVRITHAWSGPIALTTRMSVHFQRYFNDKAIYAGGYSGFGISASRFGARLALDLLDDVPSPEQQLELVQTMPNGFPGEPLRWVGSKMTMYALDTADDKGGWRKPFLKFVSAFGFPLS